jgi:hypothetical protein
MNIEQTSNPFVLFGGEGVFMAVGYKTDFIIYRGTYDVRSNRGIWNFICFSQ